MGLGLHDAVVQIVVIGLISFCCPGFFNALTGLGGAGAKNPDAGNQANVALYTCFAVIGYFGGALYSVLGNKWLMFLGGLTYASYAAGIYIVSNVDGTAWLGPVVGALLGAGAALFWTSQGAMMMAYSTPTNKGRYIAIFWSIFNLGACVGGLIQFGINYNQPRPRPGDTEAGNSASAASYFTFVVIMLIGACSSLLFLVPPEKVKKEDNSPVICEQRPICEEINNALMVATNKVMLLMAITFLSSNWFYTYQLNYLNGSLFTMRSRGLNSAFYWAAQMLSAYVIGVILDAKTSKRIVMLRGYAMVFFFMALSWVLGFMVTYVFEEHYDKDRPLPDWDRIDFTQSKRAVLPTFTLVIGAVGDAALQSFSYWLMGTLAHGDSNLSARFAGFYKGIQSAGSAVAWALDLNSSITYRIQLIIGTCLWALASITQLFAVRLVSDEPAETAEVSTKIEEIHNRTEV